ncbi:MAG: hypothetical protein A2Z83_05710, partial [Omnitrophica bacterium GWA2_52_8]
MTLAEHVIHKKVTVVMGTLGLIILGSITFSRLPQELFPPISFPQVTIISDYKNAAPEEIETLITKPIEETVGSVAGLKRIESISREGRSTVTVSFNWGQDIDFAALAVREKIDLIKDRLPKEAEDPVVLKFDPLTRPILILSVSGENLQPIQLKLLTEKMLKDNLEKVEGVASVFLSGGVNREVLVEIDQARLQANHLSLLEIVKAIEEANVSYPAGSIKKGLYEYLIRTVGEFQAVREIEYAVAGVDTVKDLRREDTSFVEKGERGPRDTVDSMRSDIRKELLEKRLVLMRDIGTVTDGIADKTSISRFNGKENIALSIQKQASANTIQVVDQLKLAAEELKEDLESRGVQYKIIYDHSEFIRKSLENLLGEALSGGFLAFLVLFFFLRSLAPSLLVTLSIPVTVVGVFFMMGTFGITLNIMSLGGLALAVGMIVDTSIVVLENIFRRRQLGEDAETGAIRGTEEVIWPVLSSNLTTIAVFFPLIVFVPGIPGQLFKDLSWTVIYSQILSVIVPLTLIPMLSVYLSVRQKEYKPITITRLYTDRLLQKSSPQSQDAFIRKTLGFMLLLFFCSLFILPVLEREVLPKVDQGQFLVKVDLPIGTRLEVTDRISQKLEAIFAQHEEVKDIAVTIGSEKTRRSGEVAVDTLRPSQAVILISLHEKRKHSSVEVIENFKKQMESLDVEQARIDFLLQENEFQFAGGGLKPILIEVKGYEFGRMNKLVDEIKAGISKIKGVIEIQDDRAEAIPETKLEIDKKRAALYGISALDVSLTAKAAIDGVVATQYREAGSEFDIRVRLSEPDRQNMRNLENLLLYSKVLDTVIPLKDVARIEAGMGPSEVRRTDQERTVTISADVSKAYKSNDILKHVQAFLRQNYHDLEDFQVELSGKAREVRESFSKVIFAFILAVLLVYMIMAAQFESFVQPLIIMMTVPLALIGVAVALLASGTSLNVISLLGIVLLSGVAVNNGIVLIEYINQLRMEGVELVQAAMEASRVRTRPILMSALTTVIALIPLALGLGEGAELRQPLAITTMGGLL